MQSQIVGFPLSAQQKRLWSSCSDPATAISQLAVTIDGPLDLPRLTNALCTIVDRHEILRTTFTRGSGMRFPFQVIRSSAALNLELQADRAFDLERGPVLFATLEALATDRHILVLRAPALCADAKTLRNVVVELSKVYE